MNLAWGHSTRGWRSWPSNLEHRSGNSSAKFDANEKVSTKRNIFLETILIAWKNFGERQLLGYNSVTYCLTAKFCIYWCERELTNKPCQCRAGGRFENLWGEGGKHLWMEHVFPLIQLKPRKEPIPPVPPVPPALQYVNRANKLNILKGQPLSIAHHYPA